jgi:hypothetical protein
MNTATYYLKVKLGYSLTHIMDACLFSGHIHLVENLSLPLN